MYTIGRLAKKFNLSRSTLLYYDSIGLLKPSSRSQGEYRLYSDADASRLEQVCTYRQAGLALKDIAKVLDSPDHSLAAVLENRLEELNQDIRKLREQQRFIVGLLQNPALFDRVGVMNVQTWTSLLSTCGFSEEDMYKWHAHFERQSPEKHQQFLEFLCLPDREIEVIRSWSAGHEERSVGISEKD